MFPHPLLTVNIFDKRKSSKSIQRASDRDNILEEFVRRHRRNFSIIDRQHWAWSLIIYNFVDERFFFWNFRRKIHSSTQIHTCVKLYQLSTGPVRKFRTPFTLPPRVYPENTTLSVCNRDPGQLEGEKPRGPSPGPVKYIGFSRAPRFARGISKQNSKRSNNRWRSEHCGKIGFNNKI